MLKGIDPLLSPELLAILANMGHGDEIIVADANFTAASLANSSGVPKPVVHLPGANVEQAVRAILTLLPLDNAVEQPVAYMHICGKPDGYLSGLQRRVTEMLAAQEHASLTQCEAVERFMFYDRARNAFAIVLTGDQQPYGNFLLKKGVLGEALDE
jgi:L-fucose mutarotase